MGAWGSGIFANDLAADVRDAVVTPLRQFVAEYFTEHDTDISLEEFEEEVMGEVLPRLAMILALCEDCQAIPPQSDDVQRWHERYGRLEAASGESDPDYREEVEQLFARLKRVTQAQNADDD
jgi:predicted trehalose synthase